MSTPNFDCFYSQRLKVTKKTSGILPPFKTSSQSANQWPSKEMMPMSKLITCHPETRYMHSCWKFWGVMSSRTAFNTSGALQDPVPTSLHFKNFFFFSRSSCSGHRVLEGTGSACKHVLSALYVHCCELGKALMCTISPLLWTKQGISCSRNLEEPENIAKKLWQSSRRDAKPVKNTIKYRHTRTEKTVLEEDG